MAQRHRMAAGRLCAPDRLSLITSLFSLHALSDHSNFHSNLKKKFQTAGDKDTCGRLLFKVCKLLSLTLPGPQVVYALHLWSLGEQAGLNTSPSKRVWEFSFCYSIQLVWWHICVSAICASYYPHSLVLSSCYTGLPVISKIWEDNALSCLFA